MLDSKKVVSSRAAISAALAVSLVTACGVEDRPIRTGSALTDAIALHAQITCERLQECSATFIRREHGNVTECEVRTVLQNKWITSLPGVTWNADTYAKCDDRWKRSTCAEAAYAQFPECEQPGTHLAGESCNSNYQCASGLCENIGYECGTCSDKLSEGDSCNTKYGCGGLLGCESDGKCRMPAGLNDACGDTQTCNSALNCYNGTCVRSSENGEHCDSSAGLYCNFSEKGLLCDPSTATCVSVTAKASGQSCAGAYFCESLGICDTSSLTCTPAPSDTGACDRSNFINCEWPAVCVEGFCELPTQVARCSSN